MSVGKLTTLTPQEQYSYMSMWCLMAAPLVFSGDMARLDAFTLNVLCNHEVIAVNQDMLGRQARIVRHTKKDFVLLKEMEDGSRAMGVFNLNNEEATVKVCFDEIGLTGKQLFRDLWRQEEMGTVENCFQVKLPAHGVSMVRIREQR
jgi:alpha-galactosidase